MDKTDRVLDGIFDATIANLRTIDPRRFRMALWRAVTAECELLEAERRPAVLREADKIVRFAHAGRNT